MIASVYRFNNNIENSQTCYTCNLPQQSLMYISRKRMVQTEQAFYEVQFDKDNSGINATSKITMTS